MGLTFNAVAGELPLVQRVWSASCDAATGFTSAAKATSMIAFARSDAGTTVHLRGPETTGTSLTCAEGWEFFGVELRLGASLPLHPPSGLADLNDALLPTLPSGRVLLDQRDWEMPTAQNVDVFLDRLVRAGLLVFDPLVDDIRHGNAHRGCPNGSRRSGSAGPSGSRTASSSASSRHTTPRSSSPRGDPSPTW